MKIYQFNQVHNKQEHIQNLIRSSEGTRTLRKVSGGEDMVLVSSEAKERFQSERIISLEKKRIKQQAKEYTKILLENDFFIKDEDKSLKLAMLKKAVNLNDYYFDDSKKLEKTADTIIDVINSPKGLLS